MKDTCLQRRIKESTEEEKSLEQKKVIKKQSKSDFNSNSFSPEPSVLETGLTVHESITLIELKNKISSFTEIPTQEMWVHKFSVNGKPRQLGNNLDSSTLFELQYEPSLLISLFLFYSFFRTLAFGLSFGMENIDSC